MTTDPELQFLQPDDPTNARVFLGDSYKGYLWYGVSPQSNQNHWHPSLFVQSHYGIDETKSWPKLDSALKELKEIHQAKSAEIDYYVAVTDSGKIVAHARSHYQALRLGFKETNKSKLGRVSVSRCNRAFYEFSQKNELTAWEGYRDPYFGCDVLSLERNKQLEENYKKMDSLDLSTRG